MVSPTKTFTVSYRTKLQSAWIRLPSDVPILRMIHISNIIQRIIICLVGVDVQTFPKFVVVVQSVHIRGSRFAVCGYPIARSNSVKGPTTLTIYLCKKIYERRTFVTSKVINEKMGRLGSCEPASSGKQGFVGTPPKIIIEIAYVKP